SSRTAFHSGCIDTWLAANQTCPLCRSTVHPTKADVLNKLVSESEAKILGNSFRIEIGSISQRRAPVRGFGRVHTPPRSVKLCGKGLHRSPGFSPRTAGRNPRCGSRRRTELAEGLCRQNFGHFFFLSCDVFTYGALAGSSLGVAAGVKMSSSRLPRMWKRIESERRSWSCFDDFLEANRAAR
ncbi:hypothetical protein RJ640_011487, partial [Escallonia rubra]